MTGRELFKIWAPAGAKWVDWVRPVLFAASDNGSSAGGIFNHDIPEVFYFDSPERDTAVILDLPGYAAVNEGLALAKIGWRPIPLYNGTLEQHGAMAQVDNHGIISALSWGAGVLSRLTLNEDAPPAFLLDSNRMIRHKMNASVFDNSWDIYAQDMPSAEYLLSNGITKVVNRGLKIQKDLARILYGFQIKGIRILFTDGFEKAKGVSVKKPRKNR